MTLTEKWKKGELAPMWYYVKYKCGIVGKSLLMETPDYYGFYNNCDLNNDVEEVLAPVPTYDEYLENEAHCAVYSEENKRLRELLKECLVYIPYSYPQFQTEKRIDLDSAKLNLLTRINAVIGESEE